MEEDPMQSCESPADPHSQASKRTDPVYRAAAQYAEQVQQQEQLQIQFQTQQQQPLQPPAPPSSNHFSVCSVGMGGVRIMKRADLIPLQDCTM